MGNRLIVAVEKLKRRKNWKKCIFDSGEYLEIPDEIMIRNALSTGIELSQEKFAELKAGSEALRAKEKALRLLSYRSRSEKELDQRMRRSGIYQSTAKAVIKDLKRLRLIDDEEFARKFINDLIRRKPAGEFLLKAELQKRGISNAVIDRIIERTFKEVSQVELARKGVQQWLARHPRTLSNERQQKVAQYLYQRGFSWSIIDEVVGESSAL